MMKTTRRLGIAGYILALALFSSGTAWAGLIQEFLDPNNSDAVLGSVEFSTADDQDAGAEVLAFSFDGSFIGLGQFGLGDFDFFTWSINPDDWSVDRITWGVLGVISFAGGVLVTQTGGAPCSTSLGDPTICALNVQAGVPFLAKEVTMRSVPEPGTLGLLGAGLIGLAWRRRRAA